MSAERIGAVVADSLDDCLTIPDSVSQIASIKIQQIQEKLEKNKLAPPEDISNIVSSRSTFEKINLYGKIDCGFVYRYLQYRYSLAVAVTSGNVNGNSASNL